MRTSLTCVSPQQMWIHVATEAFAVLAIVPGLVYVGTRDRKLTSSEKGLLCGLAAATLLVDGWLIYRFLSGRSDV